METGPRTHSLLPSFVRRPLPSVTLRQSSPPLHHSPSVVPQNPPPTVQIHPDNANSMKLVSRIKKIQEELSTLEDQCRELLSAKQDLIDKARMTLVGNRNQLHQLQCIGVGKVRFGSAQRYEFRLDPWTFPESAPLKQARLELIV
ncbi:hypothetical protein D8674_025873 [Pyrus ussuriensis x Pyrus communis]|uniref:Protein FAM33A n=1 Tax=Pyrus ussuriensis x Pyrus communis TaxID=2448454 RepID=A0A5N5I6G4_9ROSA|nr:hypothetical protein D8674_025873 [Pyrus ussuriensis x Pyrus communis]